MTTRNDGSAFCDDCGDGVSNGGILHAVQMNILMADGTPRTFHLCNVKCAKVRLPASDFAAAAAVNPVALWYERPEPPPIQAAKEESELDNDDPKGTVTAGTATAGTATGERAAAEPVAGDTRKVDERSE